MEISNRIKIYQGEQIYDKEVQKVIRRIDKNRTLKRNGIDFYKGEDEDYDEHDYCILGTDWYLIYRVEKHRVTIDSFQSLDDKNKITHAIEMITVMKELLRTYSDYTFAASLNKNSLKLYNLAKEKGYIKELYFSDRRDEFWMECRCRTSEEFIKKHKQKKNEGFSITPIK